MSYGEASSCSLVPLLWSVFVLHSWISSLENREYNICKELQNVRDQTWLNVFHSRTLPGRNLESYGTEKTMTFKILS